ncbi:MAG: hypothetical protein AAF092_04435 [Pseudomonadota bacterium]
MTDLRFRPWRRSALFGLATPNQSLPTPRLRAELPVDFVERNGLNQVVERRTESLDFEIEGPADVIGLRPETIRATYPPHLSRGAEPTFCVHVDFHDADLPWRYTAEIAGQNGALRPWFVLLVGAEGTWGEAASGDIALQGQIAQVQARALDAHPPSAAARWAHVQEIVPENGVEDRGQGRISRLLSPRPLRPEADYLAVIVPLFGEDGAPRWSDAGNTAMELPVYHHWRFRTAKAGDFRELAQRLKPQRAGPDMGGAPLRYVTDDGPEAFRARGAMGPIGSQDAALPGNVAQDLAGRLSQRDTDSRNRPITAMPRYGSDWEEDPVQTNWGRGVNADPRHRAAAGLGRNTAIAFQDLLMQELRTQSGDLYEAQTAVRAAGAGHGATTALWGRRLPQNRDARLSLFGPSFARLLGNSGSVLSKATAPDRPLSRAAFSTLAHRVLRSGGALGRHAKPGATDPENWLRLANLCPPKPRKPRALPDLVDALRGVKNKDTRKALEDVLTNQSPEFDLNALNSYLNDRFDLSARAKRNAGIVLLGMVIRQGQKKPLPIPELLWLYSIKPDMKVSSLLAEWERRVREATALLDQDRNGFAYDPENPFAGAVPPEFRSPEPDPCRPVDLDALDDVVTNAFDPDRPNNRHKTRIRDRVDGHARDPLDPVEICVDYDIAPWTYLRDKAPDWLAPGAGEMQPDAVTALETNPSFIESFLLGLNGQVAEELRWRNVALRSGCTPVRMFWGRIDPADPHHRHRDIEGVESWRAATPIGHPSHRTPEAGDVDLVILLRTDLFERYPETIVSLVPAPRMDGTLDWDAPPAPTAERLLPSFLGQLAPGLVFFGFDITPEDARDHWFMLEEPPSGYRFLSEAGRVTEEPLDGVDLGQLHATARDGASFATAALNEPVLVMIRGDSLIPAT